MGRLNCMPRFSGGKADMKLLLAVDGSKSSLKAVDWVVEHVNSLGGKSRVELVTVQLPVPKLPNMGKVVGKAQIAKFYREDGEACLAAAERKLGRTRIAYQSRMLVGPVAETLVKHAKSAGCDVIVTGTRGMGGLGNLV